MAERAIFQGIGQKFMQHQTQCLRLVRVERQRRSVEGNRIGASPHRGEFGFQKCLKVDSTAVRGIEKILGRGQRLELSLERRQELLLACRLARSQPRYPRYSGNRVLEPMLALVEEKTALLRSQ